MAKTHFDPTLFGALLVTETPMHNTAYRGGVNGIIASNIVADVDCKVCIRVMLSPEWHTRFTNSELHHIRRKSA